MSYSVKKPKAISTSGDVNKLTDSVVDLAKYVEDEFSSVASALKGNDPANIYYAVPPKPRTGMQVYADGTHWNPGHGEGFYAYQSDGTWHFLANIPEAADPVTTVTAAAAFQADKNGVSQNPAANTTTKVTFTNAVFNIGGFYDAANSKWTPPAGIVHMQATLWISSTASTVTEGELHIRKNGNQFKGIFFDVAASLEENLTISLVDQANGTDFYEIWAKITTGGATPVFQGSTLWSYWSGHQVAPVTTVV